MKYPSNTLGLVVTVSLILLITLTASSTGLEAIARAWPNATKKDCNSVCMDGTCLEVSAFQRRKLYIPQDRLRPDQIERHVLATSRKTSDVEQRIHLFYNQDVAALPLCALCHPYDVLDLVLEKHGEPDQIAIYKRQEFGETVTQIKEDDKAAFLEGLSLR